jgi:hypothetical protein
MNPSELMITTERIDDIVLVIEMMKQIDLSVLLDRPLPRHWLQAGRRWGWVGCVAHVQ